MNNLKRILIIALCSIFCVCTVPQFSLHSEAVSTSTYALYQTLLNLSGYLTTRGYSIVHEYGSSIPSITDFRTQTQEGIGKTLFSFAQKLDAFGAEHDLPDLGQKIIAGAEAASLTGAIIYSKQVRDLLDLYFSTSVSNGSVTVGSVTTSITDLFQEADHIYSINSFSTYTISCDVESIAFTAQPLNNSVYHFFILPTDIEDWSYNALTDKYSIPGISYSQFWYNYEVSYNNKIYLVPYNTFYVSVFNTDSPYYSAITDYNDAYQVQIVFNQFYSGLLNDGTTSDLVIDRITDTSSSDLLTSTNTVDSTGEIEGETTIYLPDQATLETAIDQYNQNAITYDDFLKVLGINSVASDATVQEKEDALTVVVTPSEDYLWFTKTQWGADSLEETRKASATTRAEEDSLADSIANTANGGSDPEDPDNKSRGKGLLALLLLGLGFWNTPIIAGDGTPSGGGTDDGSGDGSDDSSGYLAESIAGMAVAGSLVDDFFDSAGGSNGYGLIYTVGASFVIFSVIIGAANYFGALFHGSDTKQNIKASGKRSTPGKEKKGG